MTCQCPPTRWIKWKTGTTKYWQECGQLRSLHGHCVDTWHPWRTGGQELGVLGPSALTPLSCSGLGLATWACKLEWPEHPQLLNKIREQCQPVW